MATHVSKSGPTRETDFKYYQERNTYVTLTPEGLLLKPKGMGAAYEAVSYTHLRAHET